MCLALENSLRNMLEEGKARGIAQGIAQGRSEMVFLSVYEKDYSQERGAELLDIPMEEFLDGYHQWLEKQKMLCSSL